MGSPEDLSFYRPVYAPEPSAPIANLCKQFTAWAEDREGVKVYSTEDHSHALRLDLARNGEIRKSLGDDASRIVTDPAIREKIGNYKHGINSTRDGVTIADVVLRTDEETGDSFINLRMDDLESTRSKYDRLLVCIEIMDLARKNGIDPSFVLAKPVMPPEIKFMHIPDGSLEDKAKKTLKEAIKACRPLEIVLGRLVCPMPPSQYPY